MPVKIWNAAKSLAIRSTPRTTNPRGAFVESRFLMVYRELYLRQITQARWWQVFGRPRSTYLIQYFGEASRVVDLRGLMEAIGTESLDTDIISCQSKAYNLYAAGDSSSWVGYPSLGIVRFES